MIISEGRAEAIDLGMIKYTEFLCLNSSRKSIVLIAAANVRQSLSRQSQLYEEDLGQKQSSGRTHTVDQNENFHR